MGFMRKKGCSIVYWGFVFGFLEVGMWCFGRSFLDVIKGVGWAYRFLLLF